MYRASSVKEVTEPEAIIWATGGRRGCRCWKELCSASHHSCPQLSGWSCAPLKGQCLEVLRGYTHRAGLDPRTCSAEGRTLRCVFGPVSCNVPPSFLTPSAYSVCSQTKLRCVSWEVRPHRSYVSWRQSRDGSQRSVLQSCASP